MREDLKTWGLNGGVGGGEGDLFDLGECWGELGLGGRGEWVGQKKPTMQHVPMVTWTQAEPQGAPTRRSEVSESEVS
eukprot:549259-Rhodomonas_salina.3